VNRHDILLPLYRGAREVPVDQFLDWALRLLRTSVPFDMARWGIGIQDINGFTFPVNHLFNDDPDVGIHYEAVRSQDTAASWAAAHPGYTGNFHVPRLLSGAGQAGIRAYAKRFRREHALITVETGPSGASSAIGLYGAMPKRPFAEHERQTMQWLFPHLMEAWSINQALHAERIRIGPDERQWAVAVADPAGFLHFVEPAAWPLLEAEWPGMPAQRLPEHAIRILLDRLGQRFDGARIVVVPVVAGRLLFLKVRARVAADCLTPRERAIAAEIAEGLTHKEIARRLHLSPATVRNQIQSIHERLDVRNNAQLVAKLRQTRG
jgi:DNA-binding CsgD family transcriptional regulator